MRIEFNELEKNRIKFLKKHKELHNRFYFNDGDIGKEYSLNFKITDPHIANIFVSILLYRNETEIDGDDIGLEITDISYKNESKENIRDSIKNEINEILNKYL